MSWLVILGCFVLFIVLLLAAGFVAAVWRIKNIKVDQLLAMTVKKSLLKEPLTVQLTLCEDESPFSLPDYKNVAQTWQNLGFEEAGHYKPAHLDDLVMAAWWQSQDHYFATVFVNQTKGLIWSELFAQLDANRWFTVSNAAMTPFFKSPPECAKHFHPHCGEAELLDRFHQIRGGQNHRGFAKEQFASCYSQCFTHERFCRLFAPELDEQRVAALAEQLKIRMRPGDMEKARTQLQQEMAREAPVVIDRQIIHNFKADHPNEAFGRFELPLVIHDWTNQDSFAMAWQHAYSGWPQIPACPLLPQEGNAARTSLKPAFASMPESCRPRFVGTTEGLLGADIYAVPAPPDRT